MHSPAPKDVASKVAGAAAAAAYVGANSTSGTASQPQPLSMPRPTNFQAHYQSTGKDQSEDVESQLSETTSDPTGAGAGSGGARAAVAPAGHETPPTDQHQSPPRAPDSYAAATPPSAEPPSKRQKVNGTPRIR
jgi:hypothetical protein